jgi:hypothetical protein
MNKILKFILLIFIFATLMLALPGSVYAQGPDGSEDSPVIFGSDFVLTSGQIVKDLVVFGGNATLEQGSKATGDVVVFGGNLVIAGEVRGDVTAFGGGIKVTDSAFIGGDLNTLGGNAQISPEATVKGNRLSGAGGIPLRIPTKIYTPSSWINFGPGTGIISAVFSALILALLAVLVALFLPTPTEQVAQTIGAQPIISGGVGLLTLVVAPALFLVLGVTIILIPLSLIGMMLFVIALLFGWIAIGLELGRRMTGILHTQWATPINAGVGTLVLSLVVNLGMFATGQWLWTFCCVAVPVLLVLLMMGLGGVVASRFGSTVYNPHRPVPVASYPQSAYPPEPSAPAVWPLQTTTPPEPPAPSDGPQNPSA